MSEIYVFSPNETDLDSFGLVGALEPISCIFEEEANGMSELTLEHPLDEPWGKYAALNEGCILTADVPVRMTPEINGTHFVTAVEKTTVKTTASSNDRRVWSTWNESSSRRKKLRTLKTGTAVVIVYARSDRQGYYKVKCTAKNQSVTGWIKSDALERGTEVSIPDNSAGIEEVAPSWTVQRQLFRIYDVEKGMKTVKVHARHISYDLLTNITVYNEYGSVAMQTALDGILSNTIAEHGFTAITNMSDTRTGLEYRGMNPIKAMLDPEEGITARYEAGMVRDNYELTFLKDAGINRGIVIEYGKNLTGIKCTTSLEDVCTQIIPVGEDKDGNPLYLDYGTYGSRGDVRVVTIGETRYLSVFSVDHIADYPTPHIQWVKVNDAKEDSRNGVTKTLARRRLYEYAQSIISGGADIPSVSMTVSFVDLGDTAEFAQYKDLERLFLWDYATVRHPVMDIDKTIRVVKVEYDVLRERMTGIDLGSVGETLANTGITTWQIPTGFQGSKIATGTVSGNALQENIIAARHVQAQSIGADQIAANAITTTKLAAGAVTAEKADIASITAGVIASQEIHTEIVTAAQAAVGTANIDYAQIKYTQAGTTETEQLIARDAVTDKMYIAKLQVDNAQMVNATVSNLVIKASDGNYYRLDVAADGSISPTAVTPTEEQVEEGQMGTGSIIETDLTVGDLSATSMKAINALIDKLTAARIEVGELTAREAFINALKTKDIYTDSVLRLSVRSDISSEVGTFVRLDDDGIEVGKTDSASTVHIDDDSVDINTGGVMKSSFTSQAICFGNYELRMSADGGLVFKKKEA